MKTKSYLFILVILAGLSSCEVYSVHPLYNSKDLIQPGGITGLWKEVGKNDSYVEISTPTLEPAYQIRYYDEADTIWYDTHYLQLGATIFIDLYPVDKFPYDVTDLRINNFVPMHSFMKLEIHGDLLKAYSFDGEKMIDLFKQNRIRLKHEMLEDCVLITAGTEDLQKFIKKYSSNTEAFSDPLILKKVK